MSSDYFFMKWKETFSQLEDLVQRDLEYQKTKAHDKTLCDAVLRLSSVLVEYVVVYNQALDCLQNNLQVQKTKYLFEIVRAITNRITELKQEIRKLECSNTQFLGTALANNKLTTDDAELDDVPSLNERLHNVKIAIAQAFVKAEEKRELLRIAQDAEELENAPQTPEGNCWWDEDAPSQEEVNKKEDGKPETEEMIQTRQMGSLIQAHERSRQIIQKMNYNRIRKQMWEKELLGTLNPPARLELRERAAKIIQKVCRAYFEIKRKKKIECQLNEMLGIRLCGLANNAYLNINTEIKQIRNYQRKQYENEWENSREMLRQDFIKRKTADLSDDYRDFIRGWFRKWFDTIHYFNDIPNEEYGGSVLIMREETPDPIDWWETYKVYLEQKKANKGKTAHELKWAKMEAKEEEMMRKKEEQMKKKQEAELMKKMMKNPAMHPGYKYPESTKTEHLLEVIENYSKDWDDLDKTEILEVKKKFVTNIDRDIIYAEAKMDIMQTVDDDMREELEMLKRALKVDFENHGEKFPEPMKQPKKRKRKKKKVMPKMSETIAEKLEDLAFKGILQEYPQTRLEDFLGDHNYAGDEMRCNLEPAIQFNGETRSIWWERCREATHGYHKILLVGPRQSGKTLLVHVLATIIDAVLFVLDPLHIHTLSDDLSKLMNSVLMCARAAQPSVIYIKDIHRLFYRKVLPEDAEINLEGMKRLFTKKLLNKINKNDKITVIGSCVDPWLTKSAPLLKQFPIVVLIPDTSYSTVFGILLNWMNENRSVPRDLAINGLAKALRGYSYGQLKEGLRNFLTAERIVRIAAYGLTQMEIYNYFLDDETLSKVEYEKYQKWYEEKTVWGVKEKKHITEQLEFRLLCEKYAEKAKKKKKSASAASSATTMKNGAT